MPRVLDRQFSENTPFKRKGQQIPLRPTRMSDYKVGDTVQGRYVNYACPGIIVDVNPKIEKIMVDFGGILKQMEPDEICYVPYYAVMKNTAKQQAGFNVANELFQHYLRQENM